MKVDVFIVGAAKSGTTSLANVFSKTKGMFVPTLKEPFFFVDDNVGVTSLEEYERLYSASKLGDTLVDASTGYLFDKAALTAIYEYNPNAKIIIVLRNPFKMAISLYNYMKVNGVEDRMANDAFFENDSNFNDKVEKNNFGWKFNYEYIERAKYYQQVKNCMDIFSKNNVKVVLFEELTSQFDKVIFEIEAFLGKKIEYKNLPKSNEGGKERFLILSKIRNRQYPKLKKVFSANTRAKIRYLMKSFNTKKEKPEQIDAEVIVRLQNIFKSDFESLEVLLDRKLDVWR